MKIKIILTFGIASLSLLSAACTNSANTANNVANTSNTATVVNSNRAAVNNTVTPAVTATTAPNTNKNSTAPPPPPPADAVAASKFTGELQVGKTESLILYVGMESGDYAAYCFANDSEAGRAILAACKDKGQCEVTGTSGEGKCEVPGLEADLSDSGRITKVVSVKPLSLKK